MDLITQNGYIYRLLVEGKSITNLDAILKHGIGRLASRICDLSKDYEVPIAKQREPNSDGTGYHVRYYMEQEYRDLLKFVPLGNVKDVIQQAI